MAGEEGETPNASPPLLRPLTYLGARTIATLDHMGDLLYLFLDAMGWLLRAIRGGKRVRLGQAAIVSQIIRIGVRSILIISLVSGCIGLILSLQLAPPLETYGQK